MHHGHGSPSGIRGISGAALGERSRLPFSRMRPPTVGFRDLHHISWAQPALRFARRRESSTLSIALQARLLLPHLLHLPETRHLAVSGLLADFCQPDAAMPRRAADTGRISLVA